MDLCNNINNSGITDCCSKIEDRVSFAYVYGEAPDHLLMAEINRNLPDANKWPYNEIRVPLLQRPDATIITNTPIVFPIQKEAVFYKADTWSGNKTWVSKGIVNA